MKKADLHLHTNKSDGLLTPEELVFRASKQGLSAIAITDHDTVEGIPAGIEAGRKYGVNVIPGIEFNTNVDNGELHILGYYFDYSSKPVLDLLHRIKNARLDRIKSMVEKLREAGLDISFSQILSIAENDASLGRPHIARILVEKGYVSDFRQAFDRYIGVHCPAYVERYKLEPEKAVHVIKSGGGVPVLAHPGNLSDKGYLYRCIKAGIQGIEVYHSNHTYQQTAELLTLANKLHLIPTGGSDCHGDPDCYGELLLGQITVPYEVVIRLRETAFKNRGESFFNV